MKSFAAIDFETANQHRSICSVGVVIVKDGVITNHQLHTVATHCGFDLTQHHHALADAEACAAIALKIL
ncbi:MAG: hypothetical protein LBR66_05430 [Candidatus Symbiothrix sp.]|jgi:DNA polymerase-3 subunit epsilon|nr:hypothetical protein [Candidatus Symbiothrix sp.]